MLAHRNHWTHKVKSKAKIFTSFFQIVSQFENILQIRLPDVFEKFARWCSSVANVEALKLIKVGCLVKTNFYTRLLMTTIGPIAISICILLWFIVRKKMAKTKEMVQDARNEAVGRFLWLTYFVFVSVSTTVFFTFGCVKFGDDENRYLAVDVSVNCDTNTHKLFMLYASAMVLVYPVGISYLYSKLLFDNREAIKKGDDREEDTKLHKIAFLWDSYKPEHWYYEIFECAKRQLLTGMLVFISPGSAGQITFALMLAFGSLLVLCLEKPFIKKSDNNLAIVSNISIFCTLFASLLVRVNVDEDENYDQEVFGYLLIFINVMGIVMVVMETLHKPVIKLVLGKKRYDAKHKNEKKIIEEDKFGDGVGVEMGAIYGSVKDGVDQTRNPMKSKQRKMGGEKKKTNNDSDANDNVGKIDNIDNINNIDNDKWDRFEAEDGTPYLYNATSNKTKWEFEVDDEETDKV